MIACIAIASTMAIDSQGEMMFLPLALASIGLLASICGIGIVRLRANRITSYNVCYTKLLRA